MPLPRPLVAVALGAFVLGAAPAHAATVDLALVLAVDVSESVDAEEYELQHEGIARAFETAPLVEAIRGGKNGAIDVLVLEWSDRDKQVVTVDWTRVSDAASAAGFAARVRATPRSSNGLTAIGDALFAAETALSRLPDQAERRVVDLSGDGIANIGPPPQVVRDRLVAEGITINGLAILKTEPWLDSYYDQYVVGGPGGFLMQVEDFPTFIAAMQQKLLAEVTATLPQRRADAWVPRQWALVVHSFLSAPSGEREGPIAQRWVGELVPPRSETVGVERRPHPSPPRPRGRRGSTAHIRSIKCSRS